MKKLILISIIIFSCQIVLGQIVEDWLIDDETMITDSMGQNSGTFVTCGRTSPYWAQQNRLDFLPSYSSYKYKVRINFIVLQKEPNNPCNFIDDEMFDEIISGAVSTLNYHYDNLVNVPQDSLVVCFDNTIGEPVYFPSLKLEFFPQKVFLTNSEYWGTVFPSSALLNAIYTNEDYVKTLNVFFTMDEQTYTFMVNQNILDPNANTSNYATFPSLNIPFNQYILIPKLIDSHLRLSLSCDIYFKIMFFFG